MCRWLHCCGLLVLNVGFYMWFQPGVLFFSLIYKWFVLFNTHLGNGRRRPFSAKSILRLSCLPGGFMTLEMVISDRKLESFYSTSISMSLSVLSSPLEQELNSHVFLWAVWKSVALSYLMYLSLMLLQHTAFCVCKDANFFSNKYQNA